MKYFRSKHTHFLTSTCLYCSLFSNGRKINTILCEEFSIQSLTFVLFLDQNPTDFDDRRLNFERTKIHLIFQCLFRRILSSLFLWYCYFLLFYCLRKKGLSRPKVCQKSKYLISFSVHLGKN